MAERFPRPRPGWRRCRGWAPIPRRRSPRSRSGSAAVVVDANVERVVARLFAIPTPLPAARAPIRAAADTITPAVRAGDFAQAMMDLGSGICTVRRPRCLLCPLAQACRGRAAGDPERLPVRRAKPPKPQRHGTVFWLQRDDRVLLVTRPDKGLLGGMRALPTGPWVDVPPGLTGAPRGRRLAAARRRRHPRLHAFSTSTCGLRWRTRRVMSAGRSKANGGAWKSWRWPACRPCSPRRVPR